MNAANAVDCLVDDLAGYWTEPVLEIVKNAGVPFLSVDLELATWHGLQQVLHDELHWQQAFRSSTLVSFPILMERVLRKAAGLVAQTFDANEVNRSSMRRAIRAYRASEAERELYAALIRATDAGSAFKPLSRTDYLPRLRPMLVG